MQKEILSSHQKMWLNKASHLALKQQSPIHSLFFIFKKYGRMAAILILFLYMVTSKWFDTMSLYPQTLMILLYNSVT